jgi:putative heme iron utilization protein
VSEIRIDVGVKTDAGDLNNLGKTLDDVAAGGETMGQKIEQALADAEAKTRPTNSEFRNLARELERHARTMGQSLSDAFTDFEQHARDTGLEISDGTMDALRRLAERGPSDVDKVRDAFRDLRTDAQDTGEAVRDDIVDGIDGIRDHLEANPPITPGDLLRAEVRAEILQNFTETGSEVVRGFKDGFTSEDMDTIVDGFTDTLMSIGMVAGPAGQAGAFVASTLVQAIYGGITGSSAEIAAIGTEVRDILKENSTGAWSHLSEEARQAFQDVRAEALLTQHGIEKIETAASTLGVTSSDVLAAMAGDTEAASRVQDAYQEKIDAVLEKYPQMGEVATGEIRAIQDATGVVTQEMGNLSEGISRAEREYAILRGASSEFRSGAVDDAGIARDAMSEFGMTADEAARYRRAKTDAIVSGADNVAERIDHAARNRTATVHLEFAGVASKAQELVDNIVAGIRPPAVRIPTIYGEGAP